MTSPEQIAHLNKHFGKAGRVDFSLSDGLYPVVNINNDSAYAAIALYGAHVMTYGRHGEKPVLWLSRAAKIEAGKSIRGGIPVCWPWFGPHPQDPQLPIHGLARISPWQLESVFEPACDVTELVFVLTEKDIPSDFQLQTFQLRLHVAIEKTLHVTLESINTGNTAMTITAGLHTYFNIGDINQVKIHGLDGCRYWNKAAEREEIQSGDIVFNGKVDRIYHDVTAAEIHDLVLHRTIRVEVAGGHSIVVWNPGPGVEKAFPGFAAGDEKTMVCVEAANPAPDMIILQPGTSHRLGTTIHVL